MIQLEAGTTKDTIRILLVEQEALVRAALLKLIESWANFEVIGEAGSVNEALNLIPQVDPNLILLSLPANAATDLEAIRDLSRTSERAPVLVLLGETSKKLRTQLVLHGARGVVHRKHAAEELKRAIEKLCGSDEIWLDRTSLAGIINELASVMHDPPKDLNSPMNLLTNREREVAALVMDGHTNKEVGERLFISETTVRHHLTTIFNKLNISSRYELFAQLRQIS
jgi:DNA-binding NarL/FixJ family response regulator